jgi:hypothetical protein
MFSHIKRGMFTTNASERAAIDITARGCEPHCIYAALSQRESTFFGVRFENWELGKMNLANCYLVNVTFNNCKFGGPTAWAVRQTRVPALTLCITP